MLALDMVSREDNFSKKVTRLLVSGHESVVEEDSVEMMIGDESEAQPEGVSAKSVF